MRLRHTLLAGALFVAACVPTVDSCRVGASNAQGVIHLDASVLDDLEEAQFVLQHEFFHVWVGGGSESAADRFAEEYTIYRGISPCPAARLLLRCGAEDRAQALGLRNSCAGFSRAT